jgi:hypothetical protein
MQEVRADNIRASPRARQRGDRARRGSTEKSDWRRSRGRRGVVVDLPLAGALYSRVEMRPSKPKRA